MESAKLDWKEDSVLVVSYAGRQGVEFPAAVLRESVSSNILERFNIARLRLS